MPAPNPVQNLVAIPAAIGASKDSVTANAVKTAELYDAIGTTLSTIEANTKTLGNTIDTPLTVRTRELGVLQSENAMQGLAVEAGFNQDLSRDIRAIMLRDIRDTGLQMRDITTKIAEDKSVSIFEDPLQAIANAFTIPWDEQKLRGLAESQANRKKTLDDITSGVTNSATAEKAIRRTVTQASIDDQTMALEGMVANQRARTHIESLQNNIHSVKAAMEADHMQLQLSLEYRRYLNDERNYALHLKTATAQLEMRDWAKEERTNEKKAFEERLGYVNEALTKMKLPVIGSIYDLKSKMQTAEGKATIDDLTDTGRLLKSAYAAAYTDGDPTSVGSYIKFWERTGKQYTTPDEKVFVDLMAAAYNKGQAHKNSEGKELNAQQALTEKFDEKFHTVKKDDLTNPNRAQTFSTMLERANQTSDQNFKTIFAIAIAPNITDSNKSISAHPELVGPMVVDAMTSRKITPNQAAMFLADFYTASTQIASANSKVREWTGKTFTHFNSEADAGAGIGKAIAGAAAFAAAAIAPPSLLVTAPLIAVGTGMYASGLLSRQRTFDWTDPVQTQAYLIRKGYGNFTSLTPGNTNPIQARPAGAPTE